MPHTDTSFARHASRLAVFDIGGTYFRSAVYQAPDHLSDLQRCPAISRAREASLTATQLQEGLVQYLSTQASQYGVKEAAISLGAALNALTGQVYASAPLWGQEQGEYDLAAALAHAAPDVRWHIINDVSAVLIHYASQLAQHRRDLRKVMVITVSSGIACKTVDMRSGHMATDPLGLQGEIGHLPCHVPSLPMAYRGRLSLPDMRCDCGQTNHVAAFASGRGIERLMAVLRQQGSDLWPNSPLMQAEATAAPQASFKAALDAGDECARCLLHLATHPIADLIRTALTLDPELDRVALVGGVSENLDVHYRAALHAHFQQAGLYLTSERLPAYVDDHIVIEPASVANGLIGAALYATHAGVCHGT